MMHRDVWRARHQRHVSSRCRREAAPRLRFEHKQNFRIETPAGLSRGRDYFDPDISQIAHFVAKVKQKLERGDELRRKSLRFKALGSFVQTEFCNGATPISEISRRRDLIHFDRLAAWSQTKVSFVNCRPFESKFDGSSHFS